MKSLTLKIIFLLCLTALSACETQPIKIKKDSPESTKPVSEKQATLTESAESLLALAEDSDNEAEQFKYRAQAARHYLEANKIELAREQLNILQQKLQSRDADNSSSSDSSSSDASSIESVIVFLLEVEIAINEKNTELAKQLIAEIKPISRQQQIQYYSLKADLDFLSDNFMYAVDRRVQLDAYILEAKEKSKNNRKIWAALSSLSRTQLYKQRSQNVTISGWLDLARVMRSGQKNISKLEDDLLDWGTRHPAHPVNENFLSELINIYQSDVSESKHIAVILPMHGDLAQLSANIKNGFLSAYYADANANVDVINKPVIRFYDSSDENVTFKQLYQQAIADGASNIIGPLDKIAINQLAQQQELDVPVLTLNYAESAFNTTENLFQFGLSPEDEARQVAEQAILQNKRRAAVFYPDSEWGRRLSQAFSEHYIALGGKVMSSADYATNTNDYRRPIRAMLNLDQSTIRHHKLENTIARKAVSVPYRRQDLDMIFLAGTPRSARSIMPAFRFHHASELPVYSTSHVYTGKTNRELDRDLNGLIFCDMPWILQNTSSLQKVFRQNWPQQKNFTRLFALGIDAYHLIYNLDYLENKDFAYYDGQTGNIQLDENNRVTRKLLWAKFTRGKPVYFEPEAAVLATSNGDGH